MDHQIQLEAEAAAFRTLVQHLQNRKDVQNIDLMNLAGFCRNCLATWYMKAAKEHGVDMGYDRSQEYVYATTYNQWKSLYQAEASQEQLRKLEETKSLHAFFFN